VIGGTDGIAQYLGWHGEEKTIGRFERPVRLNAGDVIYSQAPVLIAHMDELDQAACIAAGDNPRHMLERLLVLSTNKLSVVSAEGPVLMMGTIVRIRDRELAEQGLQTPEAQFWLVSSTRAAAVAQGARALVKHAVREYLKHYGSMFGYLHDGHHRAVRLLQWLGAELEEPKPFGPLGMPFRRFTLR
jgi:hypothetical protein